MDLSVIETPKLSAFREVSVVGVTFVDDYPGNLHSIEREMRSGSVEATLVRNPRNRFDSNAIEVHVDGYGIIGHLPAVTAEVVAPLMDKGRKFVAYIAKVYVSARPGVVVRIARILD